MSVPPNPGEIALHAELRRGYLHVTITGERSTTEVSIAMWREVGRLVVQHGARRVLVVSHLDGDLPSPEQQLRIIRALVGTGFEGVRTAFVLNDALNVSAVEHGEIYARELGQESRVFGSEALAEVWLRHGE